MMNSDVIGHEGRIIEINPETISVEIISETACAGCHAKALCGMSEAATKIIAVPAVLGDWHTGQTVEVNLSRTMGFKAVWIAYVIPLVVLLVTLMTLFVAGVSELFSGLGAIAAVAVYYLCIYLLRNKLKNEYSFNIKAK